MDYVPAAATSEIEQSGALALLEGAQNLGKSLERLVKDAALSVKDLVPMPGIGSLRASGRCLGHGQLAPAR
jgi:hypothetical protein